MQIECNRYSCQKAVEVCYWVCKYRKSCKDWKGALKNEPGAAAIEDQLNASALKSGRLFNPQDLVSISGVKLVASG